MLNFAHKVAIALMLCIVVLIARLDQITSRLPAQPIKETKASDSTNVKKQQDDWWERAGEPLTVVTFFLVIVGAGQLGLFFWQLRLIRESLVDAKTAADAAKESAESTKLLAEATRAAMLPTVSFTGIFLVQTQKVEPGKTPPPIPGHFAATKIADAVPPESSYASIGVKNMGPTTVVVTSCCIEFDVSETLADGQKYVHWATANYSVGREQDANIVLPQVPIKLTPDQRSQLEGRTSKLWLYGIVTYRDVMRDEWEMGFVVCWTSREDGHNGFEWAHDTRYEFFRKKEVASK